ncbi:MAG TPA: ABC transporter permease [Ardenticatenaceae bacterium]|nr:ABC transporter permease [Ardenticatenaceae bacterium]
MMISRLQRSWRDYVDVVVAVAVSRLKITSRYPGYLLVDVSLPIMFAAVPILLGRSMAGPGGGQAFAGNTGTANYVAYMLIGSNVFMIVSGALWNIGFWIRREQQTGTLEALYLAPVSRFWILAGVALYGTVRNLLALAVSFTVGCLLFGINPVQGDILIALGFLLLGVVPLYGVSLLYGALVLRLKEANAMIQIAQWLVSLLMGIFFPVAVLPPLLRWLALAFPPTWMNNGVRAALLDVGWFFDTWYADFAVLGAFAVFVPVVGYAIFRRMERGLLRGEGIGTF